MVSGNPAGGTSSPRHGLLHHHQQPSRFLHLPGVLPPQPAGKQWPLSLCIYELVLSIHFFKSIYFWLHWVFTTLCVCVCVCVCVCACVRVCACVQAFSSCRELGLLYTGGAPHRGGISHCGAQSLVCSGFSSCSTWAQSLCGTWDLPRPGTELMSPVWAGGVPSTVPPGKPSRCC